MSKDTYRVLLIDDNKAVTDDLCRCFEDSQEFRVDGVADDGEAGFQLVQSKKPDLVILDMIMPGLDGPGFLQKCSQMKQSQKPVVVVLSAFCDDIAIRTASSCGANYYFIKPISKDILLQRLKQIMTMTEINPDVSVKTDIAQILNEIGMPPHLKGYKYILDASFLVFNNFDLLSSATGLLYPQIAQINETEAARVERDIRHAIDVSWKRGRLKSAVENGFLKLSGKRIKPSNVELIALMAEKIRLRSNISEQV